MSHRGGRGYSGSTRGSSSYRGSSNRGWGSDSRNSRGGYSVGRGGNSFGSSRGVGSGGSSFGGSSRGPDRTSGGRYWSASGSSHNSSFETRYGTTSSANAGGRYSGSSRGGSRGDESYKRPFRPDSSFGSSRGGTSRSPERKRIRSEIQGDRSPRGISSRRSHDGGNYGDYSNSNNTSHRYESSGGSGGVTASGRFSSERRNFSSSDRRASSGGFRSPPPRDEYRKPSTSSPRASYRGRISSRGVSRREAAPFVKRRAMESSFMSRGRATVRSTEYLRKFKLAKLRSRPIARRVAPLRKFRSRVPPPNRNSDKEENWENDDKANDEDEDDEVNKSKSEEKSSKDAEKKKSPKVNGSSPTKENSVDKDDVSSDDQARARYSGSKRFIDLVCPHCKASYVTFKNYTVHLSSNRHLSAMRRVAVKQKSILSRMRLAQRSKQRDLDKEDDNASMRKNFCQLCKLKYQQSKAVHQNSEAHKEMKRFLMPFCSICRKAFRSPMLYENHICSIEHIKHKNEEGKTSDKANADGGDTGSGNEIELNLDDYLTLDSIGDVDDETNDSDKQTKTSEKRSEEHEKSKTESVTVGQEHIRTIEVLFCDLCKTQLTNSLRSVKTIKKNALIKRHCREREHLRRYVQKSLASSGKSQDDALRETAERIHRNNQAKTEAIQNREAKESKSTTENEEANDITDNSDKVPNNESDETSAKNDDKSKDIGNESGEEKMWAEVDDLLREIEPGNKSSDEDEEKGEDERYDRFGYSEKGLKVDKIDGNVEEDIKLEGKLTTKEEEKLQDK